MAWKTLDDIDLAGKVVLTRVDLNVPMADGMVPDTSMQIAAGINQNGRLNDPESRWGGIMREIQTSDFEQNNNEAYYQFVEFESEPSLRYGIAMRMEQSCCDCHNTHADSTKTDWKPGQVRGILEVIKPLNTDIERTNSGLLQAFGWMSLVIAGAFGLTVLAIRRRRR